MTSQARLTAAVRKGEMANPLSGLPLSTFLLDLKKRED